MFNEGWYSGPQGRSELASGSTGDSRTWTRPCGLWEALPQNVSGSVQRDAIIRPVGKGHSQGRRVLPASSSSGNMVGAAGQYQKDARHQDSPSQDREGGKPFERCANGGPIRSSQLIQHGNDPDDGRTHEHGEELGSRLGEDEVGEQRGEASDPLRRGRDYFEQRVGGRAQEVMLPDAAHMNYEDDSELSAELGSLSVSESRSLEWKSSRILPECMEALVQAKRPVLYEVACGPNSRLNEKMKQMTGREDSCKRFAFWNGFDVGTSVGVRGIIKEIDQGNPQHVWISLECGPFSKMQQINQRNAKQVEDLKQKRETCIRMYIGGLLIFMHCVQRGITVTWEWAETSDAWRLPMVQNVFAKFAPWFCVVKGCRVQLKDPKGKGLLGKGWKLATTHAGIAHQMDLPCVCGQKHVPCQGALTRMSAYYTEDFAKRVCRALLHPASGHVLFEELKHGRRTQLFAEGFMLECNCASIQHPKSDMKCNMCEMSSEQDARPSLVGMEVEDEPLSEAEKDNLLKKIAQLHRNTGHGPLEHLVKALEDRQSDPRVVALAKGFVCPVCQELKRQVPRPRVSLSPLPPKWKTVQADNAHWTHPHTQTRIQFTIMIDEGCRFRVGKVMCKGSGGVRAEQFIQFYQEHWKPVFGKPAKLRLDPAGPWRAHSVDEYFSGELVELETIPAEAHWGISHGACHPVHQAHHEQIGTLRTRDHSRGGFGGGVAMRE